MSLSLVLNFCADAQERGDMLRRTTAFLKPETGLLFVVLPQACILNSRYLDRGVFVDSIMKPLGYELCHEHFSPRMGYFLFRLQDTTADASDVKWAKRKTNAGADRNNFAIVLK